VTDRGYYQSLAELARRLDPEFPGFATLGLAELKVSSQNGEDGVLAEILRRIGHTGPGYFIEFGIESGRDGNCVVLADHLGWHGVFIEAHPGDYAKLAEKYGMSVITTLNDWVTPSSAEELFERAGAPLEPTILSVDVDGDDYWIWREMTRYRPSVVVIEYNPALGLEPLVRPVGTSRNVDGANFGASLVALRDLGVSKGYRLVYTEVTGGNAFFVREDLAEGFGEPTIHGLNYHLRALGFGPPDLADFVVAPT
jgi:hypothetical protein